jgi:DNA-binding HxlR family transcriptional regulator
MRAGESALSLLSVPLNVHLLSALEEEERAHADLSQVVGLPPATTMRAYLRTLTGWGAIERKQEGGFPGSVHYALTASGEKLLVVGEVLQRWLKAAPNGPISLGSPSAKSAVKALVDGWSAAIVRALAARPCTLTELDRLIPSISYPTLERRLTAMRLVGQVEGQRSGGGRGTPYRVSRWLRQALAPIVAAVAWERRHAPAQTSPIGRLDIEAAFLMAVPLLEMPAEVSGSCRLAVELRSGSDSQFAGATVVVEEGRPAACVARLSGDADAWAVGSPLGWFRWVNRREEDQVEVGGESSLALALADALREALVPGHRV